MTTTQLFFAIVGVLGAQTGLLVLYINAKIDPVMVIVLDTKAQVNHLIDLHIGHSERIAALEERSKPKP